MTTSLTSVCSHACLAALAMTTAVAIAHADSVGSARLDTLRQTPEVAGVQIYQGAVFATHTPSATPLFSYERRVGVMGSGLSSAHITHDADGRLIIAEEAQFTTDYAVQRFDATNLQQGYSGTVLLSQGGRHLEYRLNHKGKLTTATEDVNDPVVTGPTLHGFVLQHWDPLTSGKTVKVRMIVLAEKTTYGFDIRRVAPADEPDPALATFSITLSHWLVRQAIAPLKVSFNARTRSPVRYEGRVPPMQAEGGKLKNLDARVDYTMQAAVYR
jgi:hypothetical protein